MVNKAVVKVKVNKVFKYPKSMLHKELFVQDALNKARGDMQVFVDEIVNNDHAQLQHDMFEYEAIEEPGYKFRRQEEEDDLKKVSIGKVAKALTTREMERKHGPLNPEVNPKLFQHDPEERNEAGDVVREEAWYMNDDIENEYYELHNVYLQLLRGIN